MENIKLFIKKNYDRKRKWKPVYVTDDDRGLVVVCNSKRLSSIEIKQILTDIYHIISTRGILGKYNRIYFSFPVFNPNDKLVYILLESVIHLLISNYGYEVILGINEFDRNINTQGFVYTALGGLAQGLLDKDTFNKRHFFSINEYHYRKIIKAEGDLLDTSNLLSEIKIFFLRFSMPDEFKVTLANVITELADNAKEHGKADCLVDIDVTEPDYISKSPELNGQSFYGINVVVLNFSRNKLGDEVKEKIKKHYYSESERYDTVENAFEFHRTRFEKKGYCEDDFFNLTAFQEKISGRVNETNSGGTGLAELIKSIQDYAYENYCYVMTGDKGLFFRKEFLGVNEDKWIGFNEEKNYISDVPNKDILLRSCTYLPGTGYNFMFVFREGE